MKLPRLCFPVLTLLLLTTFVIGVRADDGIFPPSPAAASAINFDGRGFLIHGKRTFIASGGMEYARVPHALWRDRLLRLKRAGFNCVEVYTFWNWHEPQPGVFDFTGDHDLGAFLKLVKAMGLYAIVRVGPYYCAEWDSGGYPVWLRFVPGMRVREDNTQFKAAVRRFWGKLIPIVAANQINRGGSVILVQLENEDPQGWGKEMPNSYFAFLRDTALGLGLQVPYFFSGLHHGSDPAGDDPWSSVGRTNPWMTTEFWSVWYSAYGERPTDVETYDRRFWKVLAYGGNGLNFYMLHGGTNFGYTNDDEDAASYDYGAAVGQAGDLRPLYYRFKRAALFAHSFESILENSDNATDAYKDCATAPAVRVTARKSPSGTLLFLDNNTQSTIRTQIKEADGTLFPATPLTVAPGQIMPIVHDFPLLPGVTLERSTPLLGIQHSGSITTLVAYGAPGDVAELRFHVTKPVTSIHGGTLSQNGTEVHVLTPIDDSIYISRYRIGDQTIRVLSISTGTSDGIWFVGNDVLVKSGYVGEVTTINGRLRVSAEGGSAGPNNVEIPALLFGTDSDTQTTLMPGFVPMSLPAAPTLSAWQTLPGDLEAASSYSDAAWTASADPQQMGADGDSSAYAWYRTAVVLPKAGTYRLRVTDGGDWGSLFVNGQHISSAPIGKGLPVTLSAGTSQIAVLTAHYGRPKLYAHLGPINANDVKGLSGPARLDAGIATSTPITTWRIKADDTPDTAHPPTDTTGAGWADGTTGPDIFNGHRGFAWYRTALPNSPGSEHHLHFENVDDNATVYLNGTQVAAHQGWNIPFDAPLDTAWKSDGPNELAVLVENINGGGGIQGTASLESFQPGEVIPIFQWKMRGGIADPNTLTGWGPLRTPDVNGVPVYYRTTFLTVPPGAIGPHPILRVTTEGLSRGFVWLNGHNLGRYPEKIAVNGLYLPEPWLKAGRNEIVIFDEDGNSPAQVNLTVEQAASRFATVLQAH